MNRKKNYRNLREYSVLEINGVLAQLRGIYDEVQLVDVDECRVLNVQPNGEIHYGRECFRVWGRSMRCANCVGYQACMTHEEKDKAERVAGKRVLAHSIPIYLEMLDGEFELCALDCITRTDSPMAQDPEFGDDLAYLSTHDVLTCLYTQEKLFQEIRQRLIDRPEDAWLLVMGNIRNFSLINKLFGTEGGNRVLMGIADILRQDCTSEEIYGRYRDDRFVLLIRKEKFHEEIFLRHLEKVKALVDSPIFSIVVQLGVYEITDTNMPIAAMLDHVDLTLNTLRHSRRTAIAHYEPDMMARKLQSQHVITAFEEDLLNRRFCIYLQPQVRDDHMVRGAEALVRWMRADGTVVPPAGFLNVLHESGLLPHLDVYVWEMAVRQLALWKDTEFTDMYISINVDPSDLFHLDVPERLQTLCEHYGVNPRQLPVEITETALVNDAENQSRIVERLHQAGFIVEIDDFGKGSSSLSMLKDVHADVLKIDMGFVRGENTARRGKVILESVIEMANQLHMDVITEGVETRAQVDQLMSLGCHNFQGYYYSRPIPIADFEAIVRARNE